MAENEENRTRPNWARKVRELILFNVLCAVYCGRGCLSLESEGKEKRLRELRVWNFCCGRRATDGTETRGVLRGPRGPKNSNSVIYYEVSDPIPPSCCYVGNSL